MSVYEARAELALFNANFPTVSTGPASQDIRLYFGLGELVESGGSSLQQIPGGDSFATSARTIAEWREQGGADCQTAIDVRVQLQKNFEAYAPAVNGLKEVIRTAQGPIREWKLPPSFTFLNAGNFARAFRFDDEQTGKQLVIKVLDASQAAEKAAQIEGRVSVLIPAIGGASFGLEQVVAMSYEGVAINQYAPGEAVEDIPLNKIDLLDEARLDKALDGVDEAERRNIVLDHIGEGNILLDASSPEVPFWFLDFQSGRRSIDPFGRNIDALVKALRNVASRSGIINVRELHKLVDPKILYVADSYESRHPNRAAKARDIREQVLR